MYIHPQRRTLKTSARTQIIAQLQSGLVPAAVAEKFGVGCEGRSSCLTESAEILFAANAYAFHARETRISTLMRCWRFLKWMV